MLDMLSGKRPLRRALPIGLALVILGAAGGAPSGLTHSGDSAHSQFGTPTIDGLRWRGEWDGADELPMFPSVLPGSTLLVMNDGENLYIAASVTDPTLSTADAVRIRFDNEHNGVMNDGDDLVGLTGASTFQDGHFQAKVAGWSSADSVLHGMGGVGDAGGVNFFEISHPLNSGDPEDMAVTVGESLGICVRYFREGASGTGLSFPPDCEFAPHEQGLYADVHLAVLIGDVDCSGDANAVDAALVLQYGAGLIIDLPSCGRPHANDDGVVNAVDAALILQYVAGLIPSLPAD